MQSQAGISSHHVDKINQDSAIVDPKCLKKFNCYFFAVCDGHGVNGHLVSEFLKKAIPSNLSKTLKQMNQTTAEIYQCLHNSFMYSNIELNQQLFDINLSGSTATSMLIIKGKIYVANVGDSRIIVCTLIYGKWRCQQLTIDHKPNYQKERQRIIDRGGRIEHSVDQNGKPYGPERVWLSYADSPGLAMTRSFGDKVGVQAGVSAQPEIFQYEYDDNPKFFVIASDGVFEYCTNEEVMTAIIPFFKINNINLACNQVINISTSAWQKQSFSRDDITCILVFQK